MSASLRVQGSAWVLVALFAGPALAQSPVEFGVLAKSLLIPPGPNGLRS